MLTQIEMTPRDGYLEVVVQGTHGSEDGVAKFPLVLAKCRSTGLSRVLVDMRSLGGVPAATEKLLYAYGVLEEYTLYIERGGHPLQIAYVGSAPAVSTYEPGLEVARQGGFRFELFTDMSAALAWLGVSGDAEQDNGQAE